VPKRAGSHQVTVRYPKSTSLADNLGMPSKRRLWQPSSTEGRNHQRPEVGPVAQSADYQNARDSENLEDGKFISRTITYEFLK